VGNEITWRYGLIWNKDLNTGNEKIDEQHKTLFNLVSDLIEANEKGESKIKASERLIFLAKYAVDHFLYEEKLMLETAYFGYGEHKKMHDDFKVTVNDLIDNYIANGTSDELAQTIDEVVISWLLSHIFREDKKIAVYIKEGEK